ncbi:hypothetical protein P43SY_004615 [Pythium insidiosum]|uniref:Transmembrane protein n=1 Tax=Pythium insidiosum TaxID=114742 RepID=A0AAD5Q5N5_PYTIN|nr:hypothetical protein P43SY_004615 [Pythium insidiosum]
MGAPGGHVPASAGRHGNDAHGGAKTHHGSAKPAKKQVQVTPRKVLHLVHRFLIFLSAILYIVLALGASVSAVYMLRGKDHPPHSIGDDTFDTLHRWVGDGLLARSPLIMDALKNDTSPIGDTIFLSSSGMSLSMCENIDGVQSQVFANGFQRTLYDAISTGVAFHQPEYGPSETELIAPVVDCSSSIFEEKDSTSGRFFFLTRQRANPRNVSIVVVSLSNQQYRIPAQTEVGPAGVATLHIIHDMAATAVDAHVLVSIGYPFEEFDFGVYEYLNTTNLGEWTLLGVPRSKQELAKIVFTACRSGFYIKAETEQSNVNAWLWAVDSDPHTVVSRWRWLSQPMLKDSWGWVHGVQFFIAMGVLSNLLVLIVATYQNIRAGKLWIGDAFVTLSTSQLLNGALVLISWFMNEYWCLHEFAFQTGFEIANMEEIHMYQYHMRADLLTLYLSASGLIGTLLKERIDPLFAIVCFFIGFELRVPIASSIPSIADHIIAFSKEFQAKGVYDQIEGQEVITPMRLYTTHPIGKRSYRYVFACLFPIYLTLVLVVLYAIGRKVFYRLHPKGAHVQQNTTGTATSENDETLLAQKRVYTIFELATGAELENRFGLVADYESCVFIKGMKYASADGIYSTGFLIANKKYLLQTRDFWSIVLMKLLRKRFKNIYVYEVDGSTVQQTARLVYPHTFTYADLLHLNVSILS